MNDKEDLLAFLLRLNLDLADKEAKGQPITPPGLHAMADGGDDCISSDCITPPPQ
jgi:hypothetical protein